MLLSAHSLLAPDSDSLVLSIVFIDALLRLAEDTKPLRNGGIFGDTNHPWHHRPCPSIAHTLGEATKTKRILLM